MSDIKKDDGDARIRCLQPFKLLKPCINCVEIALGDDLCNIGDRLGALGGRVRIGLRRALRRSRFGLLGRQAWLRGNRGSGLGR